VWAWDDAPARRAEAAGLTLVDPPSVVTTHLAELLRRNAHELIGRQEVQELLGIIGKDAPKLVEDVVPGTVSLGDLVRVQVVLEKKDSVLWLPPQAVRNFEGRKFVVVQDGDGQRRVDVKVGITGDDRLEIVDGLTQGQIVVAP